MADPKRRHPANAPGPWFVDTTCIDCDAVRVVAPQIYVEADDGLSFVRRQPEGPEEALAAARGLLACPTGSVGGPVTPDLLAKAYPWEIAPGVSLLGYTSRASFGAMPYLVERPRDEGGDAGNVMVDGPRWSPHLVKALEARGGIAQVFLTHRDDVADAGRYAAHFGARVFIHEHDAGAAPRERGVEVVTFREARELQPGCLAIPTPGHTRGHAMLLVDDTFLFTGDSLHGSRHRGDLGAFPDATWYSWEAQTASLARLAERHTFAWVLPGHGGRFHAPPEEMRARLLALVVRMRAGEEPGGW